MPQSASARKARRVSERRRRLNDRWRQQFRALRSQLKQREKSASGEEARRAYIRWQSVLDRMARRRIVHPNTAARLKSRWAARLRRSSDSGRKPAAAG